MPAASRVARERTRSQLPAGVGRVVCAGGAGRYREPEPLVDRRRSRFPAQSAWLLAPGRRATKRDAQRHHCEPSDRDCDQDQHWKKIFDGSDVTSCRSAALAASLSSAWLRATNVQRRSGLQAGSVRASREPLSRDARLTENEAQAAAASCSVDGVSGRFELGDEAFGVRSGWRSRTSRRRGRGRARRYRRRHIDAKIGT